MRELRDSGLLESVLEAAAAKPLFGVCVGMQMLLDRSEARAQRRPGPDPGRGRPVRAGRPAAARWQPLQGAANGLEPGASRPAAPHVGRHPGRRLLLFRAQLLRPPVGCAPQRRGSRLRRALYRAVARDNIFATQFHPEKSADHGLALYRNFLHWNP
jgi:glutamine amidotransferase